MRGLFTLCVLSVMLTAAEAQAPSRYYQFDIAGASATYVTSINNYGEIVGYCTIGSVTKAFYFNGVDTILVQYQGDSSANTYFGSINNHHLIAGYYNPGSSSTNNPFIYNMFTNNFSDPYTPSSSAYQNITVNGLTDGGCISGSAKDGTIQNYFYNCAGGIFNVQEYANNIGGNFTEYPTYGEGVNNNAYLVGFYIDGINYHGLVYNSTANTYSVLDIPSATHTKAFGINNAKTVVGTYSEMYGFMAKPDSLLGFLSPHYYNVVPTGVNNIAQLFLLAINDSNQVAGYFVDSQSVTHGIFMGLIPGRLIEYNSVLNNPNFSAPHLMNISNSDINVVPTFNICADGSNATLLKFVCDTCGAFTLQHLKFVVESDQLGVDTPAAGGFITSAYTLSGDTITARFRHPQFISSSTPFQLDTIWVEQSISNQVLYKNPIAVYRAPVVFVHGLTANQGTFKTMSDAFIASNLYPTGPVFSGSPLLYRIDYSPTNKAHFATNKNQVPNGIDAVYRQARAGGYSCGAAIVAGHSMGGVLSRLYLQSTYPGVPYRNDIQKLITVSTPHGGTQLPNYGMAFSTNQFTELNALDDLVCLLSGSTVPYTITHVVTDELHQFLITNGAFEDLSYTSLPTRQQLSIPQSAQTKVPSVTFGTDETGDNSAAADAVRTILFHAVYYRQIYCGDYDDLIVPFQSQLTGVTLQPMVPGQIHVGATDNPTVIGRIEALLDADPASNTYFTHDGFPPVYLPTPYHALAPNTGNNLIKASGPDSVKILSPTSGTAFNPGDVVTMNIYTSGNTPLLNLLVLGSGFGSLSIDTVNVQHLQFTIPSNALGTLSITLFGGDSTEFTASDTLSLFVNPASTPDSIKCVPEQASVALGLTQIIGLNGYFSGNTIPLNGLQGVSVQYDTTYLIYQGNYTFQSIAVGTTTVVFSYQGLSDSTVINIYSDSTQLSTNFDYTQQTVCTGGSVTFTPYSQGLVSSQYWSFPGGVPATSTSNNPVITYATPGIYPVTLITTFVNGTDTSYLDSLIVVSAPPAQPIIVSGDSILTTATGYSYQWYYGTDSTGLAVITGAQSDTLALTASGFYSVVITDSNGCSSNSSIAYYAMPAPTATVQLSDNYTISVYPNPSNSSFNVRMVSQVNSEFTITVYDLLGQIVYGQVLDVKPGANFVNIPVENFASGPYLLRVQGSDIEWNTAVVKN